MFKKKTKLIKSEVCFFLEKNIEHNIKIVFKNYKDNLY